MTNQRCRFFGHKDWPSNLEQNNLKQLSLSNNYDSYVSEQG
jgi:hypothetical protein